jgi:DNA invertase Pin-like site-specific DNA recombinase
MARKSRKHLIDAVDTSEVNRELYNAGGYIRFSRDSYEKRGDSIEVQRNIIENYVASSPDIRLVEVYTDNKRKGTSFERPGFQKMLADIECGIINCIIVKDLTRFGRNAIDTGYYLEKYLPSHDVRFISITDAHDSNEDDGGILLPLKNIINESYALDIGRKRRAVHQQDIIDGRFIGRLAPYGYMLSPDDCHLLVINEETAPVIRQIFAWAGDGISANEITKRLTESGVPSPAHYNFAKGYNKSKSLQGSAYWKSSLITTLLRDRVYAGDLIQGKSKKENNKRVSVDPSEWICVENTHEAIVSRQEFNRVQEMRKVIYNKAMCIQETSTPYTTNIFKGKVLCAECGYSLARKRQNKDGTYWFRCESQVKYGKNACTIVSVKEFDLKCEIIATLNKYAEVIAGRSLSMNAGTLDSANSESELREINQSLDKDGRVLKSLYENMIIGLITQVEFVKMKKDYEAKIESLCNRADEIRNSRSKAKAHANEFNDFADTVTAVISNEGLSADIIDKLIHEIRVRPEQKFDVHFRFRDEFKEVQHG